MFKPDDAALVRAHRTSAEHIRAASDSNAQSAEHVRQSRSAIQRSLELLHNVRLLVGG